MTAPTTEPTTEPSPEPALPPRIAATCIEVSRVLYLGRCIYVKRTTPKEPWAPYEGRGGGVLLTISAKDGTILARRTLDAAPVPDGLTLAGRRLLVATIDGKIHCFR